MSDGVEKTAVEVAKEARSKEFLRAVHRYILLRESRRDGEAQVSDLYGLDTDIKKIVVNYRRVLTDYPKMVERERIEGHWHD